MLWECINTTSLDANDHFVRSRGAHIVSLIEHKVPAARVGIMQSSSAADGWSMQLGRAAEHTVVPSAGVGLMVRSPMDVAKHQPIGEDIQRYIKDESKCS